MSFLTALLSSQIQYYHNTFITMMGVEETLNECVLLAWPWTMSGQSFRPVKEWSPASLSCPVTLG